MQIVKLSSLSRFQKEKQQDIEEKTCRPEKSEVRSSVWLTAGVKFSHSALHTKLLFSWRQTQTQFDNITIIRRALTGLSYSPLFSNSYVMAL